MKRINLTELITSIVFAELVGVLSALFSGNFRGLYDEIQQPPLSPPNWIFPVVWGILYALMGITSYMVWNSKSKYRSKALAIYLIQLGVNFSWSIIFFRFQLFTLGAVVAVILSILAAIMIYYFFRVKRIAGILNLPYLAWLIFASYLAIGTAILN